MTTFPTQQLQRFHSLSSQSPAEKGGEPSHPIESLIKLTASSFWLLSTLKFRACRIHSVYYYSIGVIDNGSNYRACTMAAIPTLQEWVDLACPVDRREQDSQSARCSSAHTTTYRGPFRTSWGHAGTGERATTLTAHELGRQRESVGKRVSKLTEGWVNASERLGRMDGRMFKQLNTPHSVFVQCMLQSRLPVEITPHSPPSSHTLEFSSFSFSLHLSLHDLLSASIYIPH